ncbi:alpha/beta hydrolase [Corticibacter populi]|uniref:Alpha/beta hydrolase n=1 Tax=Corticibacter populi TaxID=1550736 RepID=A0A3M6QZV2_9BURK|nr:alpha/beta hydrolase [Corticibacter populi]RMX08481.1 alpha/beta hydrolase [Corticibacter populi]RZS35794.1 pimeloyl-ACP methyl ester carboxylesterase [Corticibacter populi]
MPLILFSHANGFPAGTYRRLFEALRERGFTVEAIDRFGHDARYPVTSNWPHLSRQLCDFAEAQAARHGQPAFFVGHSLGGYLSLMAASQAPTLCRGVVLLDSPVLAGWRAAGIHAAKHTALVRRISPGQFSHKRRNWWPSREDALAHFQRKPNFARWHPEVLQDYIRHGLADADTGSILYFDREVETAIYNTLAHNLGPLLRRQPLQCPCVFIGGHQSRELRQIGIGHTRRITHGRIMMLDGSHLFPMEHPDATISAIEAAILDMDASTTRATQKI